MGSSRNLFIMRVMQYEYPIPKGWQDLRPEAWLEAL
jgi:hypothetical protein